MAQVRKPGTYGKVASTVNPNPRFIYISAFQNSGLYSRAASINRCLNINLNAVLRPAC